MKIRFVLPCVVFAFTASSALVAQDAPAGRPPKKETELGNKMEKMSSDWKKLRNQLKDPAQTESSLQLIATVKAATAEMVKLTPDRASTVPEADRAKYVESFQAGMKELAGKFDALADLVKAGKGEEATALYLEINQFQSKEHKEFRIQPPPRGAGGPGGPGGPGAGQRPAQDKKD